MENEKIVVVEKKNWIWKVVAIAAAVAALTVAVIAICKKLSKKKEEEEFDPDLYLSELDLEEIEEDGLEAAAEEEVVAEEDAQ